jgi:hypothetical protein
LSTIPQLPQLQQRPLQQLQQQQQLQQPTLQDNNFISMVCGQQPCINQCHNSQSLVTRSPMSNVCNIGNNMTNNRNPYEICNNMGGGNNMAACYNYQYGCNGNNCGNMAMQNMCMTAQGGGAACNLPFGDVMQGAMVDNKENIYCGESKVTSKCSS